MSKKESKPNGRPTVMTPAIVNKLEEAFAQGFSIVNACIWANISRETFYTYCEKTEGFLDRCKELQNKPLIKSILVINKAIQNNDVGTAKWYAERKAKDEFSLRQELTGKDGEVFELALRFGEPIENKDKVFGEPANSKDKVDPSETGDNIVDDEQD
jgi:hypothetical protein